VNRANKLMFAANCLVLGLIACVAAADPAPSDLKVSSLTVGDGENKVVIAANSSMTGLAVHKGRETVALIGLDGDGTPGLRVSGYAKARSLTVASPGSFGSVSIASNSQGSGVWATESNARFAALTVIKQYGPAFELNGGKTAHQGDDFAVSLDPNDSTAIMQMGGRDGKLHFLDVDKLQSVPEGKAKPKSKGISDRD
jgi:hypothetical protein